MKKCIYIILVSVFILVCSGCQKEDKYSKYVRIAVLSNEDTNESKILFMDEKHHIIYQLEAEYVAEVFHIDDKLYVGNDKNNYHTIDCVTIKFLKDIYIEEGMLLHYSENGSYVVCLENKCLVVNKNGSKRDLEGYPLDYLVSNDSLYIIDYSNYLYWYSVNKYELKSKSRLFNSEFISLTEVDEKCYVVSDRGFSLIEHGEVTDTYVYPYDFNEVLNVYRNILIVTENNETVVYRVSFDKHSMKLEPVYDEIYYQNIQFNETFEEYYDLGYEVVFYGEK
ncbi:MAG: hypothetical protein ACOX1F_02930 [Erysipelotrichaceae bacterium]|jgi:hypothetical protein